MTQSTVPPKYPEICARTRSDDHRAERREKSDQHCGARAVDQARQHVTAKTVGSEWKGRIASVDPDRRYENRKQILVARIIRRDPTGKNCAAENAKDHDKRDENATRSEEPGE